MRRQLITSIAVLLAVTSAVQTDRRIPPGAACRTASSSIPCRRHLQHAAADGDVQAAEFGPAATISHRDPLRRTRRRRRSPRRATFSFVAVGACKNVNTAIIDTGENGIPDTPSPATTSTPPAPLFVPPVTAPVDRRRRRRGADGRRFRRRRTTAASSTAQPIPPSCSAGPISSPTRQRTASPR
jgi:hypothetical protein